MKRIFRLKTFKDYVIWYTVAGILIFAAAKCSISDHNPLKMYIIAPKADFN